MPTRTTSRAARMGVACTLLDRLAAAAPGEDGSPGGFVTIEGEAGQDYQLGLLDLLAALGAVEQSGDGLGARVVSPLGGWFLRILCDLVDSGEPLVGDWHSPGRTAPAGLRHPFGKAADLLAALDRRRYDVLPQAAPVREVRAAVAVLPRHGPAGRPEFLLVYDRDAGAWQLPGGRPAPGDATPRDTLRRELCEELGLSPAAAGRLTLLDLLPALAHTRESPTYGPHSRTTFTPFLVLGGQGLPADGFVLRWAGEGEVRAGRAADGAPIAAEPLVFLLDHPGSNLEQLLRDQSPPEFV